ncbi:uncharacterized protein LOC133780148 [Humulus lupulus]|uniref:uncharacterized protein LOC133780148 n=1 Tax=Humulus lupulus TaxID=3486 RepID=UPI002B40EB40|nr:uncharacterized protein LOC133780148 [Humulus lupulus]
MVGWNVRGMNKQEKQKAILDVCKENKVGFGALFETKVKHEKIDEVFENNFPNWDYFSSPITSGRILVFWQAKFVKVDILLEDPQLVHCKIKVCGESFLCHGGLWNGGRQILAKDIVDAQNWLALGQVEEFKCSGAHYTWSNKHEVGDRIFSKLDRVFTNDYWLDSFPKTEACFKWDCVSDHSYCVIKSQELNKVGFIPFKYCNHWLHYRGYKETVLQCWNSTLGSGGGLSKLVQKLFRVKHVLKRFNMEEAVSQVQQKFTDKQIRYASFLKQQSKVNWVKFSDDNSRYFHAVMRKRRLENRITSFTIGDKIEDDYSKVVEHFLSHFENFMGRRSLANKEINIDCLNQGNRLTLEQQVRLLRPFNKSDVKKALFSIHSSKSPGLDGFGSGFFKGLWADIGDEISQSVLEFFQNGFLPKSLNETVISLIPKVAEPKSASNYRPIACCSTLYKCILKMICTRLSEVLPFLVHSNQGAFIKNRMLAHNIMIFQDLLKEYTRKNISARCILKIDLSKAYDTVDWHFVEELLKHLCFPSRFIDWILVCLKGTSYNLLMNGRIQGTFKGEKGLRQGDPMSPLLFVLIMEYLTRLLAHCSGKKGFGFHPMCKQLRLTNLCFADDLILFCKGNISSVRGIQEAFKKFCDSTGLSANKSKSQIFFGGVKEIIKVQTLDLVQMDEGSFPLKCLGVHIRPTKWKASDCGVILDKLNKNLNCWASRNLSFAGRAQLIHSVLLGIRNFWMSIFILPYKITAAIDKSCRDFLRGSKGNRSKLHLPSWEKVCLPKKLGGIGFREGKKWNMALMAKFLWATSTKQDCLWVKWINSIYLKEQIIWSVPIKQEMSWYFKKLLRLRQVTDEDSLRQAEKGGNFRIKHFYTSLVNAQSVVYAETMWNKLLVPKHRFIYWQIFNSQLLTRDHLSRFLPISSALCPVCESEIETHSHLFMKCIFSRKVFGEINSWLGCFQWPNSFLELQHWCLVAVRDLKNQILNTVLSASLYFIWRNRNNCIFNSVCSMARCISLEIRKVVKYRVLGLGPLNHSKRDSYLLNVVEGW